MLFRSDIDAEAARREEAEQVAKATQRTGAQGLVSPLEARRTGILLSVGPLVDVGSLLGTVAQEIHRTFATSLPRRQPIIGVGTQVTSLSDVRRSFREAAQVAEAATEMETPKSYYQLPDIRLRGLLHLMRDDVRLQTFVERELAPLLAHDTAMGEHLLEVLATYLEHGRNKATSAEALHLSRPDFYKRLARISEILDVDLNSAESCLSLHTALLALRSIRASHQ